MKQCFTYCHYSKIFRAVKEPAESLCFESARWQTSAIFLHCTCAQRLGFAREASADLPSGDASLREAVKYAPSLPDGRLLRSETRLRPGGISRSPFERHFSSNSAAFFGSTIGITEIGIYYGIFCGGCGIIGGARSGESIGEALGRK